jgi:hypothetical protein
MRPRSRAGRTNLTVARGANRLVDRFGVKGITHVTLNVQRHRQLDRSRLTSELPGFLLVERRRMGAACRPTKWQVPITQTSGNPAIGVAVSDNPEGPFEDPLGRPLVSDGSGDIDPNVYIDEDGQAYLYWGNPDLKYVRLNPKASGSRIQQLRSRGARTARLERPRVARRNPQDRAARESGRLRPPLGNRTRRLLRIDPRRGSRRARASVETRASWGMCRSERSQRFALSDRVRRELHAHSD